MSNDTPAAPDSVSRRRFLAAGSVMVGFSLLPAV
jgi:nicotinate dehydrogenase subunit B